MTAIEAMIKFAFGPSLTLAGCQMGNLSICKTIFGNTKYWSCAQSYKNIFNYNL